MDALGDPERPLSSAQLTEKSRQLMDAAGLAPSRIDAVIDAVQAVSDGGPVADLSAALRAAGSDLTNLQRGAA